MKKIVSIAIIILLMIGMAAAAASDNNKKGKEKVRVIANTDGEVSSAIAQGCEKVKEVKTLTALLCSKDTATSLGLQEDIRLHAMDSVANTQIRADIVQANGNTGSGRNIVVLDTGYNYNHPELISSYGGGHDFVNNDEDPMDDYGHGSHVAGIITADGIDPAAKGVAPDTVIIAGKVLDNNGNGYFSDVIDAIYWAVDGPNRIPGDGDDFNADAISMSFGTASYLSYGYCDRAYPAFTNAIKYARNRGVSVVIAAGNSGIYGVSFPGCIKDSITVGAVNSGDSIAGFSGVGQAVDITAPGVDILSIWKDNYGFASGTSMATPVISGVIALIKSAHPEYSPVQVQDALFNTALDLGNSGKDSNFGWGRVQANLAVNYTVSTGSPGKGKNNAKSK